MTKEELVARLQDIEWDDFEVKAAKGALPKSIWETVCAFSNCSGGWVVLGVTQKGKDFELTRIEHSTTDTQKKVRVVLKKTEKLV